jgi:hypothetical protein
MHYADPSMFTALHHAHHHHHASRRLALAELRVV